MHEQPLLQARNVRVEFRVSRHGQLVAVDDVSLSVNRGETYGLVGESGSGKTVFCLTILGLIDAPGVRISGEVWWDGRNLMAMSEPEIRAIRGTQIAMVFQNGQSALNPSLRIGKQLELVLRHRRGLDRKTCRKEALELLATVRLSDPNRVFDAYPHECSLGMCQRVALAMAISCRPRLILADEPTASLDVTTQAQIVELLDGIRREFGVSMLLVTHDFGVVAALCQRVGVMRRGQIVETGTTEGVYIAREHSYTRSLLGSILSPDPAHTQISQEVSRMSTSTDPNRRAQ